MKHLLLIALTVLSVRSYAQCSCTTSVVGGSSDLNINSGQVVCITSGNQTGNINFNGSATLCVNSGATLSSGNVNNFNSGSVLNIYGTGNFSNSISLGGGAVNVYGTLRFGGNPNQNGAIAFTVASTGSMIFDQAFTLSNGSTIVNAGYIWGKADFSTNSGTTATNNNRFRTDGNFNPAGNFTNNGIVTAFGFINVNSGNKTINNCRFVSALGFNNNDDDTENNGLIWVLGDVNSANLIQNNNNFRNAGYIRTPRIINNATLTNTGGLLRVEGSTNAGDMASRNNGGTSILGGSIGDISNASLSPAYRFDDPAGTITATYTLIPLYDTFSANFSNNCTNPSLNPPTNDPLPTGSITGSIFNDLNGLSDGTVNGNKIGLINSAPVYVVLKNSAGKVVRTVQVDQATGNYTFINVPAGTYTIVMQLQPQNTGLDANDPASVPSGWGSTGEFQGSGTGSDGVIDSKLTVTVGTGAVTNANLAIKRAPDTDDKSISITSTLSVNQDYRLSNAPLSGSDPDFPANPIGTNGKFIIKSLPPVADAGLYYDGVAITSLPANGFIISNYDPAKLTIRFKRTGVTSTSFTYSSVNIADVSDATPATYFINVPVLLPVTGLGLEVKLNGTAAQLTWKTLSESKTAFFDVEKSIDGRSYTAAGQVKATGSASGSTYNFTDNNLVKGIQYYRIKAVDADGKSLYSNVVALRTGGAALVSIFPNPAKGHFVLTTTGDAGKYQVEVMNAAGQRVYNSVVTTGGTQMPVYVATAGWSAGAYLVKYTNIHTHEASTARVVVMQ